MHKTFFRVFLFSIFLFAGCKPENQKEQLKVQRFPNEDAPLALLMREMFEDLEEVKVAVGNGERIKSYVEKHRNLLEVKPTDPKVKTPIFHMMGEAYLESLANLEESPLELVKANYQTVINTCLGCHQQYCPGPVKRIQQLEID